jgi:MFS family permease
VRGTAGEGDHSVAPAPTLSLLHRRRLQAYVYTVTGCWGVSTGLLSASLPFRFQQLGLPILDYGFTLAGYAAGMLLTESVWGHFAFRLGRPLPIVVIGAVVGGTTLLLGFATSFPLFLLAESLLGATGVYLAPLLRWVALTAGGPGSEGAGSGRWSSVFGLGLAVGVTLGPVGFVAFGFPVVAESSIAALAVVVALAASLPWASAALPSRPREPGSVVGGIATRPFLLALVLVLLGFAALTFTVNFLPYYSLVLFGGTASEAGYVLGAARIASLVASFILGGASDRWGIGRSISAGFALLLLGGVATWFAGSYDGMVVATLVFSAGVGWLSATLLPFALTAMPRERQGTAIGVFGSFEDAGLLVGPLLFGAAWSAYGPTAIFPVVAGLATVGLVASVGVAVLADRPTSSSGCGTGRVPNQGWP